MHIYLAATGYHQVIVLEKRQLNDVTRRRTVVLQEQITGSHLTGDLDWRPKLYCTKYHAV